MDREKKIKKYKRYSNIFFTVAAFLIVSALASYFGSQYLVKYQIHKVNCISIFKRIFSLVKYFSFSKNVLLANDSTAIEFWLYPNNVSTVKRKYYLFNVENPDEVQAGTAKPNLTQKGPYCFNGMCQFGFLSFYIVLKVIIF